MPRKQVSTASNGDLRSEVDTLTKRVDALESSRPGRKAKPMKALKQFGVCAIDPDRDSATCPDSSIFRYQQGCHGDACRAVQHASYVRRKNRQAPAAVPTKAKAAQKKAVAAKKAATKAKAPAKKVPAKRAPATKKVAGQ